MLIILEFEDSWVDGLVTRVCPIWFSYTRAQPCWLRGTDSNFKIKSCHSVKSTDVLNRTATPAHSSDRMV